MSRILLLSDIHANLAALDAVLVDADTKGTIDEVWSLGDAVGYGPRPNECLERLRALNAIAVAGNHELAAVGSISSLDFNPYAAAAVEWTGNVLTSESRAYIDSMPTTEIRDDFTLVHGSPRDPVWEYLRGHDVAKDNLGLLETLHCVNGHTHMPVAINAASQEHTERGRGPSEVIELTDGRWFVNPGSVGQPRDMDSRASYAVIESGDMTVSFYRAEYPIRETQQQMEAIGLPLMLIQRLELGR